MKVGYLRHPKNPNYKIRILAMIAKYYDMDFFYFSPDRIDREKKTIRALYFEEGKFVERETSYPEIIDNVYDFNYGSNKYKEDYYSLSQTGLYTYYPLGGKLAIHNILKNSNYSKYIIETYKYEDIDIFNLLDSHKKVIIKPNRSFQGHDIYMLCKESYTLVLQKENIVRRLNENEYKLEYDEVFKQGFIIQPYIESLTNQGNPFDVRINVRRGKNGKWSLTKIFARIGDADGLVSNIHGGGKLGFIGDYDSNFLQAEFGDEWETIYDELLHISKELPDVIQKGFKNLRDDIGFDVGINRANNNELKFFEVNSYTVPIFWELQSIEARFQYYMYLHENFERLHIIQNQSRAGRASGEVRT